MATMAENIIAAGGENRPPMLEKCMYDCWKTRIWIYIKGKENDEKRAQIVEDLSPKEKLRYYSDIKAVNILLLGLPVDIYTLINHYQTTKEISDRVKELMEDADLTLQEHESKLCDELEKFTSDPEESIHSYY
ncbi:hypothetical protein Tco_1100860 [Tanacetum coccineum]